MEKVSSSPLTRERCADCHLCVDCSQRLGGLIMQAGDYELQVGITEALFRFTHKGDRPHLAKTWFQDEVNLGAFMDIRDSEFETVSQTLKDSCHSWCY